MCSKKLGNAALNQLVLPFWGKESVSEFKVKWEGSPLMAMDSNSCPLCPANEVLLPKDYKLKALPGVFNIQTFKNYWSHPAVAQVTIASYLTCCIFTMPWVRATSNHTFRESTLLFIKFDLRPAKIHSPL